MAITTPPECREASLDDALAMTFPASDPVAIKSECEHALMVNPPAAPALLKNLILSPHGMFFNGIHF